MVDAVVVVGAAARGDLVVTSDPGDRTMFREAPIRSTTIHCEGLPPSARSGRHFATSFRSQLRVGSVCHFAVDDGDQQV